MRFIPKQQVPEDRMKDVTYGKFVYNLRPEKDEVNRTIFVVGGNRINYPGDVDRHTNSRHALSQDPFQQCNFNQECKVYDGRYQAFLPEHPIQKEGIHKLKLSDIPQEVITVYKLKEISTKDDSVYLEVNKGIYDLPHAGLLAQQLLQERLA